MYAISACLQPERAAHGERRGVTHDQAAALTHLDARLGNVSQDRGRRSRVREEREAALAHEHILFRCDQLEPRGDLLAEGASRLPGGAQRLPAVLPCAGSREAGWGTRGAHAPWR